jgi:hypothetical protein
MSLFKASTAARFLILAMTLVFYPAAASCFSESGCPSEEWTNFTGHHARDIGPSTPVGEPGGMNETSPVPAPAPVNATIPDGQVTPAPEQMGLTPANATVGDKSYYIQPPPGIYISPKVEQCNCTVTISVTCS